MKRTQLGMLVMSVAACMLILPASANAIPIHKHITQHRSVLIPYAHRVGKHLQSITIHKVVKYDVAPPYKPVPPAAPSAYGGLAQPTPVVPNVASASTSTGGYTIPSYIVQCESGGSYTAQNASGAYGAYQIMPSTAASYGCDLSTPAGQDSCAAAIYADVGPSAWSCG